MCSDAASACGEALADYRASVEIQKAKREAFRDAIASEADACVLADPYATEISTVKKEIEESSKPLTLSSGLVGLPAKDKVPSQVLSSYLGALVAIDAANKEWQKAKDEALETPSPGAAQNVAQAEQTYRAKLESAYVEASSAFNVFNGRPVYESEMAGVEHDITKAIEKIDAIKKKLEALKNGLAGHAAPMATGNLADFARRLGLLNADAKAKPRCLAATLRKPTAVELFADLKSASDVVTENWIAACKLGAKPGDVVVPPAPSGEKIVIKAAYYGQKAAARRYVIRPPPTPRYDACDALKSVRTSCKMISKKICQKADNTVVYVSVSENCAPGFHVGDIKTVNDPEACAVKVDWKTMCGGAGTTTYPHRFLVVKYTCGSGSGETVEAKDGAYVVLNCGKK